MEEITHTTNRSSRYIKRWHFCDTLMNKAKFDLYRRNMISNNSDNPRQLWNCINRTLHREASVSLPARDSINSLCNSFSKHFKDNITEIHVSFPVSASIFNIDFPVIHHPCTVFKPSSLTEVSKLILWSLNKSCQLDLIPTFLLKSCLHALIVPITKIINWSLSSRVFPPHFKSPFLGNHLYQPMT